MKFQILDSPISPVFFLLMFGGFIGYLFTVFSQLIFHSVYSLPCMTSEVSSHLDQFDRYFLRSIEPIYLLVFARGSVCMLGHTFNIKVWRSQHNSTLAFISWLHGDPSGSSHYSCRILVFMITQRLGRGQKKRIDKRDKAYCSKIQWCGFILFFIKYSLDSFKTLVNFLNSEKVDSDLFVLTFIA